MKTIVKRMTLERWRSTDKVECMVELDVDEDSLCHMLGHKALRNKSSRSRTCGGRIEVRVYPVKGARPS